ncbi:MAG: haloacid dehalogenase type II [Deltaproteobacteria bacterium]|nr:haloacid dehalogenase type II [Deltaproteobacteria bacterium]
MDRRTFVRVIGSGVAAAACSRALPAGQRTSTTPQNPAGTRNTRAIRAVAFDLFTIFDPRSIDAAVVAELPDVGAELAKVWKSRAFEYCWIRAAADQYVPFDRILDDALTHVLAARQRELAAPARARLVDAWTELVPWPDAEQALVDLRRADLALAPLANFAPAMIERLLAQAKLRSYFAHIISTDGARSYKPAHRAYQLGVTTFGLPPEAIAFSAFGGWDAVGATWFGYPTFWVNRLGMPDEQLGVRPAATGRTLTELAAWTRQR